MGGNNREVFNGNDIFVCRPGSLLLSVNLEHTYVIRTPANDMDLVDQLARSQFHDFLATFSVQLFVHHLSV